MMNSTLKLSKSTRALLLDNKWKKQQNFGQMFFFGFGGLGSKPFQQQDLKLKDNP